MRICKKAGIFFICMFMAWMLSAAATSSPNLALHLTSSLSKIFPAEDMSQYPEFNTGCALRGERFSFQVVYKFAKDWNGSAEITVKSPLKKHITVNRVDLATVRRAGNSFDKDVISREPGLYPDILYPYDGPFPVVPDQWHSVWVSVDVPENCAPGKYPITLKIIGRGGKKTAAGEAKFTLEVLPLTLPKQKLIVTHWFHNDCLAHYYKVPVFSEEFWKILKNYMTSYVKHGSTMILTPVFTPPLDTAVGGERLTVQLVKVTLKDGKYSFDFSLLKRWIKLAQECGIEYFEISHLFTQWGAGFCPKIMATVDGEEKRIFGWDVASDSKEYTAFLDAFLPELAAFLKAEGLQERVWFHCSDEPDQGHIEKYRKAVSLMRKHLRGFKICDALSNVEFYKQGLVSTPIPAEDCIEPFVNAGVKPLWTYYCCAQVHGVSNRFLHFPSARNRILGALLYRYDVAGFLQWGFNFWGTRLSRAQMNPFEDTTANGGFPPGDAFMVYPGPDGKPVESIHHEVFLEGMQDLRALQLLENRIGRPAVEKLLDEAAPGGKMTMRNYPRGEKNVLELRTKINALLKKHCGKR